MKYPLIRQWLIDHAGLEPSLLEGPGFESLVSQRMSSDLTTNEAMYVASLDHTPDEVDQLTAGIAVPETWLFRYPRSFEVLVEFLRNRLAVAGDHQHTLRMCSIGCATGQEPYCMAMSALHAGWPADRIHVEGVDRNREFLRIANNGEYGPASVRTEIPAWAMQYLRHDGQCIGIEPTVRSVVRFRHIDVTQLAALHGEQAFDVIFCRNVLIYLSPAVRERLLDSMIESLNHSGMLFVGHAEQLIRSARQPKALRPISFSHAFALERIAVETQSAEKKPEIVIALSEQPKASRRPTHTPIDATSLVKRPPSSTPAVEVLHEATLDDARALADAGRMHEVEPMVRAIIARRGPSAQAFELLGMVRMTANDADGAKRLFEQAVYLEPTRSTSLLQLAMISERAGDESRAAMFWDRARRASSPAKQETRS